MVRGCQKIGSRPFISERPIRNGSAAFFYLFCNRFGAFATFRYNPLPFEEVEVASTAENTAGE
jgi:hypothetical protein